MMVGRVEGGERGERVTVEKGGEEGSPGEVGGVDVEVTAKEEREARVILVAHEDGGLEKGEGEEELLLPTSGGEVDTDVDGGRECGDGEENGEDGWGGGREDGDEWCHRHVPQGHGAAPGPSGGEGEIGGV
jgi:hypothetical protein